MSSKWQFDETDMTPKERWERIAQEEAEVRKKEEEAEAEEEAEKPKRKPNGIPVK